MYKYLKAEVPIMPYLERSVLQEHSTLEFYSKDMEMVLMNPMLLAAWNCHLMSAVDADPDCTIFTEFTYLELSALQELLCTGRIENFPISDILKSLGISFDVMKSSIPLIEPYVKISENANDIDISIKEEFVDQHYDDVPDSSFDTFDEYQEISLKKTKCKKSVRIKDNGKVKKKFKSAKNKPCQKKKLKSTYFPTVYNELPEAYMLPKLIEEYKEDPGELTNKKYFFKKGPFPEEDFACGKCGTKFSSEERLDDHKLRIHEVHLKCPLCLKVFRVDQVEVFKLHTYNHEQNVDLFETCIQCGKLSHIRARHKAHLNTMGPFHDDQCAQCPQTFKTHEEYKLHVKKEHFDRWVHKCGHCKDETFTDLKDLTLHISFAHKKRSQYPKEKLIKEKVKPKKHKKPGFCHECGKEYMELRQHMIQVHLSVDQQVPCSQCDSKFKTPQKLQRHIQDVHEKIPCSDCGKMVGKRSMSRHIQANHTMKKNFKCTECGKAFINSANLRDHINTHTGERPYKCKYCPKDFASDGTHRMHEKGHLGFKRANKK